MKAIVQDVYGPSEVLELRDVERPAPAEDEVLVRVRAAGVDQGVWHLMTGLPYLTRAAGFGLRTPKIGTRGRELAGVVEAVGGNVVGFRPGDEVFGTAEGSFAEYVCAKEGKLALKPVNLSFEQAAAVPISAGTALQGLRDSGRVQPGQEVLIVGAGGGVGTYAVQLAKSFGARVTGVCSTAKIGARPVPRRRPRDRLHARRLLRRREAVGPDSRHRRQPQAFGPPPGPEAARHPGDRRR